MEAWMMGTIIVGGVLLIIVALIIRYMIRQKKAGKSAQCGCGCENCHGCH
jgi:hypothetical protein